MPDLWLRQFPGKRPVWGKCHFIFDPEERQYDWFVVYNDFPLSDMKENLACSRQQTLLVTTEPPSIKSYGNDFTRQFGCVLTSQPAWALPHSDRIFSQPALHWFWGWGKQRLRSYDDNLSLVPERKNRIIATVCSDKQQRHTLHNKRFQFTRELKKKLPELDIYGHGVRLMDDKAEALDDYRYHLAIENYQGEHHWTEKLADAFLGLTLPFYFGCPNAADYFPPESFVPIDIFDPEAACEKIQRVIRDDEYRQRLPHILEARRRVLDQYNIFAVLAREIELRQGTTEEQLGADKIFSRRLLRKNNPGVAVRDFIGKSHLRIRSLWDGK
jgi:hypothetical protein